MDAFYASVEVLDFPELAGLPVIVGGSSDRSVVSAASYEARKYMVHSALSVVVARKRCPLAIIRPVRMERYLEVSQMIMAIFRDYTPLVEQISVDEAFLDVTGCGRLFGSPVDIAITIRKRVKKEIGLTVSAGVASSKLVAKIASDQNKPDGLTVVPQGREVDFLAPLPIKRLWGVGKKIIPSLKLLRVDTIGDLTRFSLEFLEKKFGRQGRHMYFAARAIDRRAVEIIQQTKSIGNEITFSRDLTDLDIIKKNLLHLAVKVGERIRYHGYMGSTISLKVKYYDFITVSRSMTLPQPANDSKELYTTALVLLSKTMAGVKSIRLVGLTVGKIVPNAQPVQLGLFDNSEKNKRREITEAVDAINLRYGSQTIRPARLNEI
jgi:DNA polymerase-4